MLNPFLYYQVLFNAYDLLPAQQTAPLTFSWAITLALLSVPLLGQRIGIKSFAALLISFTGVLVISTKGDVLGLVFVVGNLMQQFTYFTGRSGGVVRRPALVQLQGQDGRGGGYDITTSVLSEAACHCLACDYHRGSSVIQRGRSDGH